MPDHNFSYCRYASFPNAQLPPLKVPALYCDKMVLHDPVGASCSLKELGLVTWWSSCRPPTAGQHRKECGPHTLWHLRATLFCLSFNEALEQEAISNGTKDG